MDDNWKNVVLSMSYLLAEVLAVSDIELPNQDGMTYKERTKIEWTSLVADLVNSLIEDPCLRIYTVLKLTEPVD